MEYFLITPLSVEQITGMSKPFHAVERSYSIKNLNQKPLKDGTLFKHYITCISFLTPNFPGELVQNHGGGGYSFTALSGKGTLYAYEEEASWQQSDEWWATQYERWKLYRMTQLLEE